MITIAFESPYIWIMMVGAILLLMAQMLSNDRMTLYGIFMVIGLLMIIIPVIVQMIEIIRFHI